jgi:membrane protease YdiL (CAAX protease family)
MKSNSFSQFDKAAKARESHWSVSTAILVWLMSAASILLVPAAVLIPYGLITRGAGFFEVLKSQPDLLKSTDLVLVNVLGILPAHLLTLMVAYLVVTKRGAQPFRESLGWNWGGLKTIHVVVILGGFFALAYGINLVFPEQENNLTVLLKNSREVRYAIVLMAVLTAPLVEEVVYRGVLYTIAVIFTSLLFGLVHVPQYWPSIGTVVLIFLLSVILTLVRARTGNLLPSIVVHLIFNALQSALIISNPSFADGGGASSATVIARLF